MDPKKLPPAVLLALGLGACGRCGEPEHLGPCLSVVAPPEEPPQPEDLSNHPCLSALPDPDARPPVDTGAGPCLSVELPPEEPPAHPCLSMVRPPDRVVPPEPDIQPCLEPLPEDLHPCLSIAPPKHIEPPPPPPEEEEGASLRAPEGLERQAALRRVLSRDALPVDIIAALNAEDEA
ncbi:MAG: hypothetical protein H6741_00690 [Alphaproteobacteria bacterium]|nr:hypothetical protein [Alphaproteobacteria bacterium]